MANKIFSCVYSDINVIEVANCFLIRFKVCSTYSWYGKSDQNNGGGLTGSRDEPITTTLLNGHSIKLISKFVSRYPLIKAALRPHHRSFS